MTIVTINRNEKDIWKIKGVNTMRRKNVMFLEIEMKKEKLKKVNEKMRN